jgi:diadenosine tetraphosphate (Ap4A) HIT family hydrolase
MKDGNKFVDLDNARVDDQRHVMENIIADDVCPFCTENLAKYHKRPIVREGMFWLLTTNQWPYKHTKHHFLAIAKEHVERIQDLPAGALQELGEHFAWAIETNNIGGGGFFMRFGNPDLAGSTVRHLHAQLVEPDLEDPEYEPVRAKIGKSK